MIVGQTDAGLVVLDCGLRIREHNSVFPAQCGTPVSGLTGRNFIELIHPSVRDSVSFRFERFVHGRDTCFEKSVAVLWIARIEFTGSLTGMAVRSDDGTLQRIIVLVTPDPSARTDAVQADSGPLLSSGDARVLEGVAVGASTMQLATALHLSRQGVEYRIGTLLRRFAVPNRAALVSKAYSMGLLKVGAWPPQVPPECIRGGGSRAGRVRALRPPAGLGGNAGQRERAPPPSACLRRG